MLERDRKQTDEGSGTMLFQLMKSVLMILPQSTCYRVLRDRLVSVSNFRQSTMIRPASKSKNRDMKSTILAPSTLHFVGRTCYIRSLHCQATWQAIRHDSLEMKQMIRKTLENNGADRRSWLGYSSKEEQLAAERTFRDGKRHTIRIEEIRPGYHEMASSENQPKVTNFVVPMESTSSSTRHVVVDQTAKEEDNRWKDFWATADR